MGCYRLDVSQNENIHKLCSAKKYSANILHLTQKKIEIYEICLFVCLNKDEVLFRDEN